MRFYLMRFYLTRYKAYRHKYGPLRAFWRGVVKTQLYLWSADIVEDDLELMDRLIKVEVTGVEFHLGGKES